MKTMEKEAEKENEPKNHEFILTNPDWLHLPEPIVTNIILEHLEIVDYIRFSAVCKKWQSIQKEHRIRYSPYPPPLPLSFPWLRCVHPERNNDENVSILFHLPDKQKSYRIPFLKTFAGVYQPDGHGCLLLLVEADVDYQSVVSIINPITAVQIKLPPCPSHLNLHSTGHISSPMTDPDCIILIADQVSKIYLYRLKHNSWKNIDHPNSCVGSRIVFCNNKIYYMKYDGGFNMHRFYVIDTLLPDPIEQMIEMDYSEINAAGLRLKQFDLVNFFGEVVMVFIVYEDLVGEDYDTIKEFHVYKADFLTSKWMRIETLGDRVLFYSFGSIFGLSAINVGCKKNTIYSVGGLKGLGVAWRAFDVSTRDWIDGPPLSLPSNECKMNRSWSWFLPTLDYINVTETYGAR